MNCLLDTHTFMWSMTDQKKLSPKVIQTLENTRNTVLVSAISFWEIALKYSIGKLELQGIFPHEFPQFALQAGFGLLPLMPQEAASNHQLKGTWHRDPFDRMLIRQAIQQNMTLISKDEQIRKYRAEGLKTLW